MYDDESSSTGPFDGIIYLPCKFCKSIDYDHANGVPHENPQGETVFEPESCDICDENLISPSKKIIH